MEHDKDKFVNVLLQYYTLYAIGKTPNRIQYIIDTVTDFSVRFQMLISKLNIKIWYDILKDKHIEELQIIYFALQTFDCNILNSDSLHSKIILDIQNKIVQNSLDKILIDYSGNLKQKIKRFSKNFGYLVVQYERKNCLKAKEFCLANFSYIIYETECDNWIAKLKFYIKEIELTIIYVKGRNMVKLLTGFLKDVSVRCINDIGEKNTKCLTCKKWFCSIGLINYYFRKFHHFQTHYSCASNYF